MAWASHSLFYTFEISGGKEGDSPALPHSRLSVPPFAVGPPGACRASSAENRGTSRRARAFLARPAENRGTSRRARAFLARPAALSLHAELALPTLGWVCRRGAAAQQTGSLLAATAGLKKGAVASSQCSESHSKSARTKLRAVARLPL
jgi:hypothetical protein